VRDFLAAETVVGQGSWMDDVILRDGPIVKDGRVDVPSKPGLGIELNKEVVRANLASGEKYWE
jgi:L-alanine-DL-glutamate epimerase-like enolase superfamily enzyme